MLWHCYEPEVEIIILPKSIHKMNYVRISKITTDMLCILYSPSYHTNVITLSLQALPYLSYPICILLLAFTLELSS